jgi:uncharacterized membrane protein YkoI
MKKLASFTLALFVLFTLVACSGGTATAASTIAIDVNPSVVLELDENDVVINVITNNEDAVIIVGDMDLIGVNYNVAMNALIGSMVSNGYINELANSILLSIQSDDVTKEAAFMTELSQAINDLLNGNAIEGSVITQSLDFDDDAEQLAEELGISEAKAELIFEIIEVDPRMVVEDLATLSINDLNLLLESKNYVMEDVEKSGTASSLDLITADEAYQAALLALELDETLIVEFEVELEQEDGVMVYEVEFETTSEEFEVLIHAKEGTVYVEIDDDDEEEDEVFPVDALSEEAIITLVANELGLDETLITELEFDQEMDNGVAFYEIEFVYEGVEYELEVNALTGFIYSNSMDADGFDFDDDDEEDDDDDEEENEEDDEELDEEEDEEETEDDLSESEESTEETVS